MNTALTAHARTRLRQRGFREEDTPLLLRCASEMTDGTLMITDRDIRREVDAMRRRIVALERLRGMTAVLAGCRVVTVYRQSRRTRRCRTEPGEE